MEKRAERGGRYPATAPWPAATKSHSGPLSSSVSGGPGLCNVHIKSLLMRFEDMGNSVHVLSSHLTSCYNIKPRFSPRDQGSWNQSNVLTYLSDPGGPRGGYAVKRKSGFFVLFFSIGGYQWLENKRFSSIFLIPVAKMSIAKVSPPQAVKMLLSSCAPIELA